MSEISQKEYWDISLSADPPYDWEKEGGFPADRIRVLPYVHTLVRQFVDDISEVVRYKLDREDDLVLPEAARASEEDGEGTIIKIKW